MAAAKRLLSALLAAAFLCGAPARSDASGASCSAALEARLARMEAMLAEVHAAVLNSGQHKAKELVTALGSQWVAPGKTPGEATLHFMYGLWDGDDAPLPPFFRDTILAWARLNPSYTIKLWSAAETKALWFEHFPEYRALWGAALPIQRADIGRVMILLVHGGAYADLDTRPARPLDVMLEAAGFRRYSHNAVVCIEDHKTPASMEHTARWPIRKGVPEFHIRAANYFFWAAPGSEYLKRILKLAAERVNRLKPEDYLAPSQSGPVNNPYAIIYSTGPDVVTEATFPLQANGERLMRQPGLLVIPKTSCDVINKATGTWIDQDFLTWMKAK